MTFFKRYPVAVVICALVILLCCYLGYSRVYVPPEEAEAEAASGEHHRAGESDLNYYLGWMDDQAGFFTPETADTIARRNLSLDSTYSSIVAIHTVETLEGKNIETCAKNMAERIDLGGRDMLLLLDKETQDWYVVYGPGLQPYVEMNAELKTLFNSHLSPDFFAVTSNRRVILLFDALQEWFAANVPPKDTEEIDSAAVQRATVHDVFFGILFTLVTNIWWILILVVALTLLDRARCRNYVLAHPDGHDPAHPFHPMLFWHHSGSNWYANIEDMADYDRYGPEDEEFEDEDPEEYEPEEETP